MVNKRKIFILETCFPCVVQASLSSSASGSGMLGFRHGGVLHPVLYLFFYDFQLVCFEYLFSTLSQSLAALIN